MLSHAMFQKINTCKVTFLHFLIEMYMKHELQTLSVLIESALSWLLEEKQVLHTQIIDF